MKLFYRQWTEYRARGLDVDTLVSLHLIAWNADTGVIESVRVWWAFDYRCW